MMRAWLEQLRPALPLAVPGQPAGRPAFRYLRAPAGTMEPQTNRPVYEVNRALGAGVILHDGMAAGSSSKEPARLADRADTGTHRSEEHTSELQSLMRNSYAVFCVKKKITKGECNTLST